MADKIRLDKPRAVAELSEQFRGSSATLLTEYRGLTVAQITELRRSLGTGTTYEVAKNTLAKRAAAEAGIPRVVTTREADDLLRAAESFVASVEAALELALPFPVESFPVEARVAQEMVA